MCIRDSLYPDLLNVYGDVGNILILKHRAELRGIKVNILNNSLNDAFDVDNYDIVLFGDTHTTKKVWYPPLLLRKKWICFHYCHRYNSLRHPYFLSVFEIGTAVLGYHSFSRLVCHRG